MKRLLTICFCLTVLGVLLFALPASADTSITSASVTITAPAVGASPDYSPVMGASSYYSADYSSTVFLNDVMWTAVTADNNNIAMTVGQDTFQAGHKYRVTIYLTPRSGYAFSSSCTGKVNGNTATVTVRSDGQLKLDYQFDQLPAAISSVSLTVTAPSNFAHPNSTPHWAAARIRCLT